MRSLPLAVLGFGSLLPAQYTFTQQPGLVTGPVVRSEGVVLADLDGDGDLDVVFANGYVLSASGQAIQPTLLQNRIGEGLGLVDATASTLPIAAIRGTLVVACDVDGDLDLDLVFACNGPSQQRLYVNDGNGVFSDQSVARLGTFSMAAAGVAYGDVDQDGDLDLLFADEASNGQLRLLRNDGTGHFTNVTATDVAVAPKTNQQDLVLADLDGDFDLDVVVAGKSAGQQIFFNDGTGRFPTFTTALLPAGTSLTYEAEAADLDHDGDLDLTMLSTAGLADTVLRNELVPTGTLSFTNLPSALIGGNGEDDNEWAFVDFDDDGWLDLVTGSLQSNGEKLYRNNGAFGFVRQTGVLGFSPLVDSTLDVAIGDLDGDGRFDVVTAQGESGNYTNRAYFGTAAQDTTPPRCVRAEALPAALANPAGPWVVRAVLQDSMVDDGETAIAAVRVDWTLVHATGVATGSTPMRFLGGLLYRADISPPLGLLGNGGSIAMTLVAVDRRGNSSSTNLGSASLCGLQRYGDGLGGTNTVTLSASGSPVLGGVLSFGFANGGPSSSGFLILGLAPGAQVLPQGVLLVEGSSLLALLPIAADANGTGALPVPIPPLPVLVGVPFATQALLEPPLLVSNGVLVVVCP